VLTARNGEEALRVSRDHPGEVALLITDVIMPGGMNGKDLASKMTGANPATRVLYMSGYTANTIVHHGVLDEGAHFIAKPFSSVALLDKVREVLDAG